MTDDLKILAIAPIAAAQRPSADTPRGAGFGAALDQAMDAPREPEASPAGERAGGPRERAQASRKAQARPPAATRGGGKDTVSAAHADAAAAGTAQGQARAELERGGSPGDGVARSSARKATAAHESTDIGLTADDGSKPFLKPPGTSGTEMTAQDTLTPPDAAAGLPPIPGAPGQASPASQAQAVAATLATGATLPSRTPVMAGSAGTAAHPPLAGVDTAGAAPGVGPGHCAAALATVNDATARASGIPATGGPAIDASGAARAPGAESSTGPRSSPVPGMDPRASGVASTALPQPMAGGATAAPAPAPSALAAAMGGTMAPAGSPSSSTQTAAADAPRRADSPSPIQALAARIDWRGPAPGGGRPGDQGGGGNEPGSAATRMLESIQLMRQAGGASAADTAVPASFVAALAGMPTDPAAATAPAAGAMPALLNNPWPIDDPAFASHLATQVGESVVGGLERAEISVTPPEMGPIRIELSLAGDQASVAFAAAMPETRNAIEQSLPMLRSMLSEQGLVLADASVGRGDGGAGDGRGTASADGGGGERREQREGHGRSPGADDRAGGGPIGAAPPGRRAARGLLDLFA